jgi:hypothetical protein
MGNHLLDSRSPELKDSLPFTSTFIYGAYDGELTFWEPMITIDFLRNTRDACLEIAQPQAFRQAGYYPTQYCVRQDQSGQRTVSLEGFRYSHGVISSAARNRPGVGRSIGASRAEVTPPDFSLRSK